MKPCSDVFVVFFFYYCLIYHLAKRTASQLIFHFFVSGLPDGWEKIESPNFGVYYVK